MEHRGRPVAGAIAGFMFGMFLGFTLMLLGVFSLGGPWLVLAPVGLVLGALWGWWAPLGRTKHRPGPPAVHVAADTSGAASPAWTVRPITGEIPIVPPPPPVPPPAGPLPAVPPPTVPPPTVPPTTVPPPTVPPPTPVAGYPELRPVDDEERE
jgi:hypothetical protein